MAPPFLGPHILCLDRQRDRCRLEKALASDLPFKRDWPSKWLACLWFAFKATQIRLVIFETGPFTVFFWLRASLSFLSCLRVAYATPTRNATVPKNRLRETQPYAKPTRSLHELLPNSTTARLEAAPQFELPAALPDKRTLCSLRQQPPACAVTLQIAEKLLPTAFAKLPLTNGPTTMGCITRMLNMSHDSSSS